MSEKISALILAAGKGKRMKSSYSKVLHSLLGKPVLFWVIEKAKQVADDVVVVLGHSYDQVKSAIESQNYDILLARQKNLDGTGGAVRDAIGFLKGQWTLILCGDMPLIEIKTLRRLIKLGKKTGTGAILVSKTSQPGNYGRVWIENATAKKIVEYTDLPKGVESDIINTGTYFIRTDVLKKMVANLRANNKQREFYLTDIVEMLAEKSRPLKAVFIDLQEALGINSRKDLVSASEILRKKIIDKHLSKGVSIYMPDTVWIEADVKIGRDTVVMPFTVIRHSVKIGCNCQIGPFAHIRSGTKIGDNSVVGNFVEVNRSVLSEGVYAKHLSYLGDCYIGKWTNIGAGTITANYDGKKKHKTKIGKGAFIGSGAILIAPVKVGNNSVVGAGAVVTKGHDVKDGEVVVGLPARPFKKK